MKYQNWKQGLSHARLGKIKRITKHLYFFNVTIYITLSLKCKHLGKDKSAILKIFFNSEFVCGH